MSFRSKPDRVLKKGINADETRRKREEQSIEIRRNKREESLAKKRSVTGGAISGEAQYESGAMDKRSAAYEQLRQLPSLTEDVLSEDPQRQVQAVTQFRKLLSIERSPPIQEVIACGVIPRFVQFLQYHHNPTLQFEAAWALTNVASGTHEHTKVVIDSGAVEIFVQLLSSPSEEVREQAVWALGNIAGDSPECRDLVLKMGAMPPLLKLCRFDPNAKVTMLRNATWTLSNFTRGKHQPDFNLVKDALPVLAEIIQYSQDPEVLTDACWALSYLSDDTGTENMKIAAVIDSGVAPQLVRLLQHSSANVKTPALRTVGNIVTGDDKQTAKIIDLQALPALKMLLSNPKKGIRKEACWTISNIAAGSPEQIQAVINAGLIEPLVGMLQKEEFDIKKEATWAVSNATAGGDAMQIRTLVQHGVIPALCSLFSAQDPNIVPVALEGIENILRVGQIEAQTAGMETNPYATAVDACGGLDALEQLQQHANEKIYEKVQAIITAYFGIAEDSVDAYAPQAQQVAGQQGMQQFAFNPQQQNQQFRFQ